MRGKKNTEAIKLRLANVKGQNLMVHPIAYFTTRKAEININCYASELRNNTQFGYAGLSKVIY